MTDEHPFQNEDESNEVLLSIPGSLISNPPLHPYPHIPIWGEGERKGS